MKYYFIFILLFVTKNCISQFTVPRKYINDAANENNYIIFNSDSTFKFRRSIDVMHDISCGRFNTIGDTIFLHYDTDLRDKVCNQEIDVGHFDSTLFGFRPAKLFYSNDKLYQFEDEQIIKERKLQLDFNPGKSSGYRRKYLFFGPYVKIFQDVYYMIVEEKVKWKQHPH